MFIPTPPYYQNYSNCNDAKPFDLLIVPLHLFIICSMISSSFLFHVSQTKSITIINTIDWNNPPFQFHRFQTQKKSFIELLITVAIQFKLLKNVVYKSFQIPDERIEVSIENAGCCQRHRVVSILFVLVLQAVLSQKECQLSSDWCWVRWLQRKGVWLPQSAARIGKKWPQVDTKQ